MADKRGFFSLRYLNLVLNFDFQEVWSINCSFLELLVVFSDNRSSVQSEELAEYPPERFCRPGVG